MATISASKMSVNVGIGTIAEDLSNFTSGEHDIDNVSKASKLIIIGRNSDADTKVLTIKASNQYVNRGQGDLEIDMIQNNPVQVNIEPARFLNSDGTIEFEVETGATGEITVIQIP